MCSRSVWMVICAVYAWCYICILLSVDCIYIYGMYVCNPDGSVQRVCVFIICFYELCSNGVFDCMICCNLCVLCNAMIWNVSLCIYHPSSILILIICYHYYIHPFFLFHPFFSPHLTHFSHFSHPILSLALHQNQLSKERKELKQAQANNLIDSIPKDLSKPWEDPMPEQGE